MSTTITHVGIDVAKESLSWSFAGELHTTEFTRSAMIKMARLLAKRGMTTHWICEASGGYERDLLEFCWSQCLSVSLVNAERVRYHARAAGRLAKTDPIDARVIADFARAHQPEPTPAPTPEQRRLQELARSRQTLLEHNQQLKNRMEMLREPDVIKIYARLVRDGAKALAVLDQRISELVASQEAWIRKSDRMQQVKGVGALTANQLLAFLPELGSLRDTEVAALTGLAPYDSQSGQTAGNKSIRGGRFYARKTLYMAAVTGTRHNPILKAFYLRLRKAGKPAKVALVAVMRKLVVLLNRLLKNPDFVLAH